jgi:hypothetical protein
MKVKVQYTVEVDRFARCGIGMHFGKKANRDDIKYFLEHHGISALEDMVWDGQQFMEGEEEHEKES